MGNQTVELKGQDERNLARLGLILGPRRIAENTTQWERKLTIDVLGTIEIRCVAQSGAVVPHGIDNDIMIGLINLTVALGAPENGRITATASELLRFSGLKDSGTYFKELPSILARLQGSSFSIIESWYDGKRFKKTSKVFSLITQYDKEEISETQDGVYQFKANSRLVIDVGLPIVESVRNGHVRALDMEFYSSLSQPLVRSLYRQLEERRTPFNAPASRTFSVLLTDWGAQMGLHCERPGEIRKSLLRAHVELVKLGYLKDAHIEGRGAAQVIHYHFTDLAPLPTQKHVLLLTERGISAARANELARKYPGERIEQAAKRFDELTSEGQTIRNPGGYLSDILETPDKYLPGAKPASAVPRSAAVTIDMPALASHAPARPLEVADEDLDGYGAARGVLKALVGQGKLTEGEALACLGLLEQKRITDAEVTLLVVSKKKVSPSEQLATWLRRPTPLL